MKKTHISTIILGVVALSFSLPAMAEEIEWRYFTSPNYVSNLEAGETGYKVCAAKSWATTAPDKDKVALVPTRQCDFPSIPSEGAAYGCLGGGDVVAVNWTTAKAEGKAKASLKMMSSIGFKTVVIPESTATVPDYSSICAPKKDPEKIARIKKGILDTCSGNAFSNVWYDCSCMAASYEAMASKDTGSHLDSYLQFINWHTSRQPTVCLNEAAIKEDKFSWCMSHMESFYSEHPKKNEVCSCTADEVLESFKKAPNYSEAGLREVTVEAQFSCRKKIN